MHILIPQKRFFKPLRSRKLGKGSQITQRFMLLSNKKIGHQCGANRKAANT